MTAPERIYMKPNDMYENGWARPIDTDQFDEEATEYVRADLAAVQPAQGDYFEGLEEGIKIGRGEAQPAQVRVKPLVWDYSPESMSFYAAWVNARYRIEDRSQHGKGFFVLSLDRFFEATEPTLDAAKAAAQADYEARTLAALEPQPISKSADLHDPRDEVIARLVDALEQFLIEYDEVDLAVPEPQSMVSAVMEARAALAAAKVVQHG